MKFGRIYTMKIEGKSSSDPLLFHDVSFPLTCRFRVGNNGTPSASVGVFEIYNLRPETRNDLYVDPFDTNIYRQIYFSAGYAREPSIPVIFKGNIYRCYSYRRPPDWITHLECFDGGYAIENGTINVSVPAPKGVSAQSDFKDLMSKLIAGMPKIKLGIIGQFGMVRSRGITFSGNPWDLLVRQVLPLEGQVYIDKEIVNIVQQREYIVSSSGFDKISLETGLLETPIKQEGIIKCRMLFEPRIEIMQKVTVDSLEPYNNGDYKVMRIDHAGTISGAVADSLITEVTAFSPLLSLEPIS